MFIQQKNRSAAKRSGGRMRERNRSAVFSDSTTKYDSAFNLASMIGAMSEISLLGSQFSRE